MSPVPVSSVNALVRLNHIDCYRAQSQSNEHPAHGEWRSSVGNQQIIRGATLTSVYTMVVQDPLYRSHFYLREHPKEKTCKLEKNYSLFMNNLLFWPFCFEAHTCSRVIQRYALLWCTILKAPLQAFTGREHLVAMATCASFEIAI